MLDTHTTLADIKGILRKAGAYKFDDKSYHLVCNSTSGSPILSNIETDDITVGDNVSGTGIPKFSTILSIDIVTHTTTISANATATGIDITSMIESSGGRIWFKSKENKGTTFNIALPSI